MAIFVLTWAGLGCWCVCFWWMHRISSRQDAMLKGFHSNDPAHRAAFSAGHDLIRDVHPQVGEIKEQVETVKEAVASEKN